MTEPRKFVIYGPLGAGKTTFIRCFRHAPVAAGSKPRAYAPRAPAPRTERFTTVDHVVPDACGADGAGARVVLATVSAWAYPDTDRRLLVKGADGVLFVADSRPERAAANVESMTELLASLRALGKDPSVFPLVMFFNKRDLPGVTAIEEMRAALAPLLGPGVDAAAFAGVAVRRAGVFDAMSALTKRVFLLPDPIVWESTGDEGIAFRALADGKRLYVKCSAVPGEPLYTLVSDGELIESYDAWPRHWVMPRVRVAAGPAPRAPAPSAPATPPAPTAPPAPASPAPASPAPEVAAPIGPAASPGAATVSEPGSYFPPPPPGIQLKGRVFVIGGYFKFSCGTPAGIVHVAVVADGPHPLLLGAGLSHNGFSVCFTRESLVPEDSSASSPGPLPNVYLVISIPNRAGDDLLPVHRYDIESTRLETNLLLGDIVLPLRKGDRPARRRGLERAPGANVVRKQLRLDDGLVWFSAGIAARFVEEQTGWRNLQADMRFEIVDDFVLPMQTRIARLLGRTDFDERETERIDTAGRALQAFAFWDSANRIVYLNRVELEQQNLGFLQCTIGHELVHVGQSTNHPEIDAYWHAQTVRLWTRYLADEPPAPGNDEEEFGFMANLEGYADYIERFYLMAYITCSTQMSRADTPSFAPKKGPAASTERRTHTELDVVNAVAAPPSLRSLLMTTKTAQYDSGHRAYRARHKAGGPAVRFDPALRPPALLPERILKPLMEAALAGDVYSQMSLGDIFRSGGMVGVRADRAKALRWYRLAAAAGSTEASVRLRALEAK